MIQVVRNPESGIRTITNSYKWLIILILVQSCTSSTPEEKLRIMDLDKDYPGKDVSLSEIMQDIRIVALETKEESLIPSNFRHYLGDKYIFIFTRDNILQFSSDGKFVRNLANAGKGPGEFNYVSAFTLNPAQDKLYISHQSKDLLVLDVETGSAEKGMPYLSQQITFFLRMIVSLLGLEDFLR